MTLAHITGHTGNKVAHSSVSLSVIIIHFITLSVELNIVCLTSVLLQVLILAFQLKSEDGKGITMYFRPILLLLIIIVISSPSVGYLDVGLLGQCVGTQQTRDIGPMLDQCWSTVYNAGPNWVDVSCLLYIVCLTVPVLTWWRLVQNES